ncbi:MAG: retroviral-like aspartic protease family protein [Candidatus Heimdallarchaeota archaeon]|nr:retroviral-like aspartic protease family protein [Candidatus Heimdallarchaeota archaeon]
MNTKIPIYTIILLFTLSFLACEHKSGRRNVHQQLQNTLVERTKHTTNAPQIKTIVKMTKSNGIYQIPVEINGVKMFFIFDTGAGLISISVTEANFLYKQGKLSSEDIVGEANFSDANGDISEGTIIILRTVKIGNRTLQNIEASVVHNLNAPLLMGQSALEKFGKISIDYQRGEITFE